jgi:hypothetical protein
MSFNPNRFKDKSAKQEKVLAQVSVELRPDPMFPDRIKIHVLHPGFDPSDPVHATQIMDMLASGLQAFIRQWVPKFEKKLITEIEKPLIQVAPSGIKLDG